MELTAAAAVRPEEPDSPVPEAREARMQEGYSLYTTSFQKPYLYHGYEIPLLSFPAEL